MLYEQCLGEEKLLKLDLRTLGRVGHIVAGLFEGLYLLSCIEF